MQGIDQPPLPQWTAKCVYILLLVTASFAMGAMMLPTVQRHLQATFRDDTYMTSALAGRGGSPKPEKGNEGCMIYFDSDKCEGV